MSGRVLSRRSMVWLILTALLTGAGAIALLAPGQRANGTDAPWPAFDLQGHRGARGMEPENSLPAFEAALGAGVSTLEMDVGMTADGVLVVHHGRRLDPDRTRDPDGAWLEEPTPALRQLNAADLANYDIGWSRPGSRIAQKFRRQEIHADLRIPTLAAVLARAEARSGGAIRYNIEIKTSPLAPDETAPPDVMADALAAAIIEAGVASRATVQSFDWRGLRRVQKIAPGIATVYLTAERPWLDNVARGQPGVSPWTAGIDVDDLDGSIPRAIKAAGGSVWSPYFRDLRGADLAEAHRLGLRVVVWTVNDVNQMQSLIAAGVDGIITDFPLRLRAAMEAKGLALPPAFPKAP